MKWFWAITLSLLTVLTAVTLTTPPPLQVDGVDGQQPRPLLSVDGRPICTVPMPLRELIQINSVDRHELRLYICSDLEERIEAEIEAAKMDLRMYRKHLRAAQSGIERALLRDEVTILQAELSTLETAPKPPPAFEPV